MNSFLRSRALLLLFALIGLTACEKSEPLERTGIPVAIQVARAVPYAPRLSLTGEVRARIQSDMSFKISGRIIERLVNVGDHVVRDQLLARLDPTQQLADVASAKASLSAAEAQARQATSVLQRQRSLQESGFTTRVLYDRTVVEAQTAENAVQSARAELAIAKLTLQDTELRAEADGIVISRSADVGEVVEAVKAIFNVARDGPRDVWLDVNEAAMLAEFDGPEIQIQLVGDTKIVARGRVREVSPTINPATGTIRVKVGIDAPPAAITLGALVVASARLAAQPVIMLPWTALTADDGHPAVWIVDPANQVVTRKPVEIVSYETGTVQISAGLSDGDRVVVQGGKFLTPGQKVSQLEGTGS